MQCPTFGILRVIAYVELLSHHIALPHDCIDMICPLLDKLGSDLEVRDERNTLIFYDVLASLEAQCSPIVSTDRDNAGNVVRFSVAVMKTVPVN